MKKTKKLKKTLDLEDSCKKNDRELKRELRKQRKLEKIKLLLSALTSLDIFYDDTLCDLEHAYLLRVWLKGKESLVVNFYPTTQGWVPTKYRGISGRGLESLYNFLKDTDEKDIVNELPYYVKMNCIRDLLDCTKITDDLEEIRNIINKIYNYLGRRR